MWLYLKNSKLFWIALVTSLIACGIAVLVWLNLKKQAANQEVEDQETADQAMNTQGSSSPIDDHELYSVAVDSLQKHGYDDRLAKMIVAQAKHETGNFKSAVFKRDNNLFGMNHPVKRETVSRGKDSVGYAVYDSWQDSVEDLVLWFNAKEMPKEGFEDVRGYVAYIKSKGYFTDSFTNYYAGVQRFFNTLKINS